MKKKCCVCITVFSRIYGIFAILVNFIFGAVVYISVLFTVFPSISVPGINIPLSSWLSDQPELIASQIFVLLVSLVDLMILLSQVIRWAISKWSTLSSTR